MSETCPERVSARSDPSARLRSSKSLGTSPRVRRGDSLGTELRTGRSGRASLHWGIFVRLCEAAGAKGNLVPDAYLAALAIESGSDWITTDRAFSRFPDLLASPAGELIAASTAIDESLLGLPSSHSVMLWVYYRHGRSRSSVPLPREWTQSRRTSQEGKVNDA